MGGIVFGHIGDRYSRKTALLATLGCMGAGGVAMGLLPTHAQAGIWATALLVLVRLVQGFSAGGEVGGSATFISESAPARLEATYGTFTSLGSTMGFTLAAAVAGTMSTLTTDEQMASWGWRVPFLPARRSPRTSRAPSPRCSGATPWPWPRPWESHWPATAPRRSSRCGWSNAPATSSRPSPALFVIAVAIVGLLSVAGVARRSRVAPGAEHRPGAAQGPAQATGSSIASANSA